jgi:DNA repair protein RadA/Sms
MAASKIIELFECTNCGAQFPKWNGRCLECGGWGTLSKQTVSQQENEKGKILSAPAKIINLAEIKEKNLERYQTGIGEVDRVLGGGLVPGSLVLLSGEPGIGKSTILAQIADAIGKNMPSNKSENKIIYVSGEESASQIKSRLERLNCDLKIIDFISETNVEKISASILAVKPVMVIIDSIQTVYSPLVPSEAGNISQIRAATVRFLEVAKANNIAIIIIGHITKDGQIAGPKSLEHIVDTVVYLESELSNNYRVLRATKNRFGSINELGIFEMTSEGFKEVANPSRIFMEAHEHKISGSVISAVMEGTRPFLTEIQALVTKTIFGYPQRKASGFDLNRLQVLTAVLTKRAGVNLSNQDVILNVVGGLKINDPALDLSVCLAIASSLLNQIIDRKTIVLGEVGLGGEIRNVSKLKDRLIEAERLGFTEAIIPESDLNIKNLKINKIKNLSEAIRLITDKK